MTALSNDGAHDLADDASRTTPAPRRTLPFEALRYLAASVAALAIDSGLLWIAVAVCGLAPWLGGAIGYGAGLVFIYVASIRWVFAERKVRDTKSEFVVFAVLGLVGLALNSLTLQLATAAGLSLAIAKILSAGIGFVANFASRKLVLFTRRA